MVAKVPVVPSPKRRISREMVQKRNITVAPLATAESMFTAQATRVGSPNERYENR